MNPPTKHTHTHALSFTVSDTVTLCDRQSRSLNKNSVELTGGGEEEVEEKGEEMV